MKRNSHFKLIFTILLSVAITASSNVCGVRAADANAAPRSTYIKWMTFKIPQEALSKAMKIDIKAHAEGKQICWVDLLSYLGTKYGGNWKKYKDKDMDTLAKKLQSGQSMAELTQDMRHYSFFSKTYGAVLSNFIGDYKIEVPGENGSKTVQTRYGLKVFSPIAKGFGFSHYKDFGDSRSFGFSRPHLGNDLMGNVGTPIIAVESGVVEAIGWNRYGGWRIGIRSFDKKRSYYYAHLRKGHPYVKGLKMGQVVRAGDVIGYLGMTGYSNKEDINNMTVPHLHFGMQIIFDESQKEGTNQIWIDVYNIVELLSGNRVRVRKDDTTKDYYRVCNSLDLKYKDRFPAEEGALL